MTLATQPAPPAIKWMSLLKMERQFQSNLAAMRDRDLAARLADLQPEAEYFVAMENDSILLGRQTPGTPIAALPNPMPPAKAKAVASQIFPAAQYNNTLLIAGLDQGWLWDAVYKLNCVCAQAPGLRLPLYPACGQLERLWAILHYQNWPAMLADPRVQILAGPDAITKLQELLCANPRLVMPRISVTLEQALWAGRNLDALMREVAAAAAAQLSQIQSELAAQQAKLDLTQLGEKFRHGPLRILGITSRFTTFLQYSMRDWLAALQKLGHQTNLIIEASDHEVVPPIDYTKQCLDFQPDLILVIDHFRAEIPGLPAKTPCVMWVQDWLPHIYHASAGAAQGPTDYVIGHGWRECKLTHGYPAQRFMPALVGVNEDRFTPAELSDEEIAQFGCDVSFVSHASMPAKRIIEEECRRAVNPALTRLLHDVFERLNAVYESGNFVTEQAELMGMLDASVARCGISGDIEPIRTLFRQRVNNALLRHQAIRWVAATGVDLRLYGRGWEEHPEFAPFARGVADNEKQLATIYRASRINLQVTPFGSVHQRSLEGLAAGGFFLMRGVSGDTLELLREQVWTFCRRVGANDGRQMMLLGQNDPEFNRLMNEIRKRSGADPASEPEWFYAGLQEAVLADFTHTAFQLWPEFDRVVFWNQQELTQKVKYFLSAHDQRKKIAHSMRRRALQCHTYGAISRRMLSMIADDLSLSLAAVAA